MAAATPGLIPVLGDAAASVQSCESAFFDLSGSGQLEGVRSGEALDDLDC